MKNSQLLLFVGISLMVFFSCEDDTLIFPEKVEDNSSKEPIDVFVKPTDVNILGDYNQTFIFQWPTFSEKMDKIKITYTDAAVTKEIFISDFSKSFTLETETIGEYEFKLVGISKEGLETESVLKKSTNKGLYINDVFPFISASSNGFDVEINWPNELKKKLDFTISYTDANGSKVEYVQSDSLRGVFLLSGLYGNQVKVDLKDEFGNVLSKSFTYTLVDTDLKTAASKTGWSSTVSSNHDGDGGGAAALIDGNQETFWHTPWSGTILPWPHSATITFNNVKRISKFELSLRHNNGTGSPKDFDLQTSSDGVNFTTQQSFVNTSTTAKAVIPYTLSNSVETKFIRFLFKTSNNNLQFMSLGEINFTEISLQVN